MVIVTSAVIIMCSDVQRYELMVEVEQMLAVRGLIDSNPRRHIWRGGICQETVSLHPVFGNRLDNLLKEGFIR